MPTAKREPVLSHLLDIRAKWFTCLSAALEADLTASSLQVLMMIMYAADGHGRSSLTQDRLTILTGRRPRTVCNAIKQLKTGGYPALKDRGGPGGCNRYQVHYAWSEQWSTATT